MAVTTTYSRAVLKQEFRANFDAIGVTGDQLVPDVLGLKNGGFVVAYNNANINDGYILLDFYDSTYNHVGGTQIPYQGETNAVGQPALIQLSNGNVVVAWDDLDGAFHLPTYRLFNSSGTPIGNEDAPFGSPVPDMPRLAALAGGGFVHTEYVLGELCIEFRNDNFGQVTPNIFVNGISAIGEKDPSITTLTDGGIVVTYTANDSEDASYMRAAIFNSDGSVRKADFLLSAFTGESLSQSEVVGLPNGNWAVVFTSSAWDEGGALGTGITLQIRDPNGANLTPLVVHVNTPSTADESDPDITLLANGFILVTWTRELSATDHDIYGRVFDQSGNPVAIDGSTAQFVVTFSGTDDRYSAVSRLINGRFVAAWQDSESDGSGGQITALVHEITRTTEGDGVANIITGDALRDTIRGFGGNDVLDGGGGADVLAGGPGDDALYVDNAQDVIVEAVGEGGGDAVFASVSYTLTPGAEVESIVANSGGSFISLTGNEFAQTFIGQAGTDIINGRGGKDTLTAGLGIDIAVFSGNRAAYAITRNGVATTISGPDGTDTAFSVERLRFDDVTVPVRPPANDFNGDGRSDVLFSNQGAVFASNYEWQLNNRSLVSQGAIDLYDKAFTLQAIGDYDGDAKADVLFQNSTTGGVWQWRLDGRAILSQGAVDVADPSFHLLGTGDFNGDGKDDVLFRNNAGFVYEWQMDGLRNTPLAVGPLDPKWHVQGTGDFNGDGRDDILLRNISNVASENGAFFLWQMNGNIIAAQGGIERPPTVWKTLGIGDFDGDGKDDFAVRNVSNTADKGAVWIYLMNGTTIKAQGAAGIADPATWKLQQISDLDGDGKDDILYRNDAGYFYSWNMNGTHIASEGLLQGAAQWADPSFAVVKPYWDLV